MPKKSSKTKTTKTSKSTVVQEAAPVAPSTNQVASAPVDTPPTVAEQFTALLAQLSVLRSQVTSITSQVRALSKNHEREVKAASKSARKKRKSGNRQPSGFVKPAVISDELAGFLGKSKGTEMARTEVTREINSITSVLTSFRILRTVAVSLLTLSSASFLSLRRPMSLPTSTFSVT